MRDPGSTKVPCEWCGTELLPHQHKKPLDCVAVLKNRLWHYEMRIEELLAELREKKHFIGEAIRREESGHLTTNEMETLERARVSNREAKIWEHVAMHLIEKLAEAMRR